MCFNADRTFNRHFDIKLPTSTSEKNRTKRPIAVKIGYPFRQTTRTISQLKTGSDPALTKRTHLETLSETFVSKLVASKSFPLLQGEFRSATLDLIVTDLHDLRTFSIHHFHPGLFQIYGKIHTLLPFQKLNNLMTRPTQDLFH